MRQVSHVCVRVQAAFLIPISVCVYTTTGGLKATFLSSYIHTVIIYVALCIFAFTVYATGSDLGSPSKVSTTVPRIVITPNADRVSLYLTDHICYSAEYAHSCLCNLALTLALSLGPLAFGP